MISLRCSKITRRWSLSTLSYFRMFLRISKLRASTFCWAFSSALLTQGWVMASPGSSPSLVRMRVHALGAEDAHQIVLQRQEEFGGAGIALAAGAAAQLVVDAAAFMALGADHIEAAGGQRLLLVGGDFGADARRSRGWRSASSVMPASSWLDAHVDIAAQLDVGAAAGHVGGDGDRARHAGLGDDEGFLLVIAGVQHIVLDLALLQQLGKLLRISRSRWCRPAPAGRGRGIPSISLMMASFFSSAVR